jgi:predicted RNA binding protein YcfA (HicA-like mRNA interferase family)
MSPHLPHLTSHEVVRLVKMQGFAFDRQKETPP